MGEEAVAPPGVAALDNALLDELLADAKVVALYVQKAGRILDTDLFTAIANVARLPSKSWADPEVVELQTAFTKVMHALSPMTLQDLKGRRAPFNESGLQALISFSFIGLIISMIFAAGWLTLQYDQGRALILSIEDLKEVKAESRISDLVREILVSRGTDETQGAENGTEQVADTSMTMGDTADFPVTAVDAVAAETYLRKLQEMRALDDQTHLTMDLAKEFIERNVDITDVLTWGRVFPGAKAEDGAATSTRADTTGTAPPPTAGKAQMAAIGPGTEESSQAPAVERTQAYQTQVSLAELPPVADACAEDQIAAANVQQDTPFSTTPIAGLIRSHFREGIEVTCLGRMNYHIFDYPQLDRFTDRLRYTVNIYGLWLLPALYGALGAALFYLRVVLDPLQPTPQIRRVVHRVMVGGFAGVIIAWIWAPSAQINGEFQNVGLNLFFVAFLIGYSIDVFFAALDRLVNSVTGSIGKIGTSQTT